MTSSPARISALSPQAYTVVLRAVNAVGAGPASNAIAFTPLAPSLSAPRNLIATPGNGSATLVWSPPEFDGGSPVTGYRMSVTVTTTTAEVCRVGAGTLTCLASGLANGAAVTLSVAAVNALGVGPAASVSVTPIADRVGSLVAIPGDAEGWFLFDPAIGAVTGYEWRLGEGEWSAIALPLSGSLPVFLDNLTNGVQYCVQVRPLFADAPGSESAAACFTPLATIRGVAPEADLDIESPPEVLELVVENGVGLLTFPFNLESTGSDVLPDAWLLPIGLPDGAVVVAIVPDGNRGSLMQFGERWLWRGVYLSPAESVSGTMTVRMEVAE